MKRALPPLNALRAFEAAGRNGSFSRAASELNVTQGAVSQQIKILEEWLEVKLFRRVGKSVELTDQGAQYLASIGPALTAISNASVRLTSRRVVMINAPPALTMRWLLPRLVGFRELHPGVEISIETGIEPVKQLPAVPDVIIRRNSDSVPGLVCREFLSELNFPVCTPAVLAENPIREIRDLERHTLIHSVVRPLDWPSWLDAFHAEPLVPAHDLHLEFLYFAIQAAIDGLGIAMGTSSLVASELADGRLVMPFGPKISRSTSYYMITKPNLPAKSPTGVFCEWLVREGATYDERLPRLLSLADGQLP